MSIVYLDASAFVKTVADEPESDRLEAWLRARPKRASCALLRTEAVRAVREHGTDAVAAVRRALPTLHLIALDDAVLDAAADLAGPLRSLDAIHLAAALSLGDDLDVVVTYDDRMARAAHELGLETIAP